MAIFVEDIFYVLYTLIGPFLIVYSMSFGLLRKAKIFGDYKKFKKIYAVVSLVFSIYFVVSLSSKEFASKYIAAFMYQILVLFMILLLLSMFYGTGKTNQESAFGKIIGVSGLIALIAIWYTTSYSPDTSLGVSMNILEIINTYIVQTGVYIILILLGSFYLMFRWLTSEPKPKKKDDEKIKKMMKALEKHFGGFLDELMRER